MRVFWWDRIPNLGDVLTRLLLEDRGVPVEWAPPSSAEFVGIGSVLESFHERSHLVVWGTGRCGAESPATDLRRADVRALRGMHTQRLTRGTARALGEPALLAPELEPRWDGGYTAIVPHWSDQERMRALYPDATLVDVMGDPHAALRDIAGAERIIASAFHGLVLADAYGIPRSWEWFDGVLGRGFKFRDYGTVMGHAEPGEWVTADERIVEATRKEMAGCLTV